MKAPSQGWQLTGRPRPPPFFPATASYIRSRVARNELPVLVQMPRRLATQASQPYRLRGLFTIPTITRHRPPIKTVKVRRAHRKLSIADSSAQPSFQQVANPPGRGSPLNQHLTATSMAGDNRRKMPQRTIAIPSRPHSGMRMLGRRCAPASWPSHLIVALTDRSVSHPSSLPSAASLSPAWSLHNADDHKA